MRIVQISNFPPSLVGGQEAVVYHLSRELGKLGHELMVITSTAPNATFEIIPQEEFNVASVPSWELEHRLVIPRNLEGTIRLIRDADIVHVHSPDVSFALEMGFLSKLQRKPIVTSVLCYFDSFRHPFLPMRILAFPIEISVGLLAKISDTTHVKNARDYAKMSRLCKNVAYIPDGIPDHYFQKPKNPKMFKNRFGIDHEKVILYVGRIHPLKGVDVLIKSVKYIAEREKNFVLTIVGPSNSYRQHLESLVRELGLQKHVIFTGVLSEEEKISAYDAADVVVIPSCIDLVEAFSLVASEAWARCKPVVASRIGALKYRVEPKVNGYLAEPNNPRDFAERITMAFGMNPRHIPEDVCSWKAVAESFEQLYEHILSNAS